MSKPSEWAIHVAAQCWCDPRVSDREMDTELATVFAEKLEAVMSMRAQMQYFEEAIADAQRKIGDAGAEFDKVFRDNIDDILG